MDGVQIQLAMQQTIIIGMTGLLAQKAQPIWMLFTVRVVKIPVTQDLFLTRVARTELLYFKSCFPNSDLGGNPDDPPQDGEWYTVGHAKFVYNQLLDYFITSPDKLFIAITPPPLLNRDSAENAREFSRWLVEDWLEDNNYPLDNVAVWDFHNILTHPDNHHRFQER